MLAEIDAYEKYVLTLDRSRAHRTARPRARTCVLGIQGFIGHDGDGDGVGACVGGGKRGRRRLR
jgi:hypothetical protein